jgi:biotin operon repressor
MNTKTELLLAALQGRPNEFIDLPYLAAVTGTFDVRTKVSRLRDQGYWIENKIVNDGRTRHSFYRLSGTINDG